MYLFPLGYGTIAADRRAEEERLREEARAELLRQQELERQQENDRKLKEIAERKFREKEQKRLDPGHHEDNPLSELSQKISDELRWGRNSFGNYGRLKRSVKLDARDRHDVARAMATSEIHFGLLDPIALNLSYDVFDRFTAGAGQPSFPIGDKLYSWEQLKRGPLSEYTLPGRLRLSEGTTQTIRSDLLLEQGALSLRLSVLKEGGLRWSLRGASLLKPSHRKVVAELNEVLEDYELRLKWLAEYREGHFVPGYSPDAVRSAQDAIDHFNGSNYPRMDWLKPGVFVPREYTLLTMNDTRIYPIRCVSCERVARTESFWPQSFTKVDWRKGKGIYHTSSVETPLNRIVSSLHSKSGCDGFEGIDARSGDRVAL